MRDVRAFLVQTLGPGLLFAGTAVGVSHLVQSTRAGASFGLSLVALIIAANILKYPAFSFGPRYAAATGRSLLDGYRRQGRWALLLYAVATVGTMFTVQAGVTLVNAALVIAVFEPGISVISVSALLLVGCFLLLVVGRYPWLDRLMKVIVTALTLLTLVATALVLPRIAWGEMRLWPSAAEWNPALIAFVAPLLGWMPSGIDVSVWSSLWTLAKRGDTRHAPSVSEALLDFRIGYVATALLAVCFVFLGAGVLYGAPLELAASPGAFANQVISLYTATLGDWSRYVIGGCACAVMFSTTLTVMDGFPRALAALVECVRAGEHEPRDGVGRAYWVVLVLLASGALLIIHQLAASRNFTLLIDVATALTFVTAPVVAGLNHRAMFAADVPEAGRPGAGMRWFSLSSVALFGGCALLWLYVQLAG
ncbi:transporter [Haliangium ochraceum DSM 14365]|uniref:Transporter n=2 Tax=Haliangium ochraceum TaxID=80816 RepID=D0LRD9_HALO1|nr:Nramp family divalent metal transporter [Haliangium ochraceum]ACY17167.1 transporter [Haliangium ochraceum DSM 14365]